MIYVACTCRLALDSVVVRALAAVAAERKAGTAGAGAAPAAVVILHARLVPASPPIVVVVLVHCTASTTRRGLHRAIHAAARGFGFYFAASACRWKGEGGGWWWGEIACFMVYFLWGEGGGATAPGLKEGGG